MACCTCRLGASLLLSPLWTLTTKLSSVGVSTEPLGDHGLSGLLKAHIPHGWLEFESTLSKHLPAVRTAACFSHRLCCCAGWELCWFLCSTYSAQLLYSEQGSARMRSARLSAEPLSTSYAKWCNLYYFHNFSSEERVTKRWAWDESKNQTTAAVPSACVFVPREPSDVSPSAWIGDISCLRFSSKLLCECHGGK